MQPEREALSRERGDPTCQVQAERGIHQTQGVVPAEEEALHQRLVEEAQKCRRTINLQWEPLLELEEILPLAFLLEREELSVPSWRVLGQP